MIIRGGGAMGAAGLASVGLWTCICATLPCAGGCIAGGALPACAAGVVDVPRGGRAIPGGAVLADVAGVVGAGGITGTLGGITTTDGGR